MRYVVCYIVLVIAVSGCVSIPNIPTPDPFTLPDVGDKALPKPFVDDFSESMVRVVVPFTILGPKMDKALASTLTPADDQCATFGREAELTSGMFRKWGTNGHYIFLFSCVESPVRRDSASFPIGWMGRANWSFALPVTGYFGRVWL